MKKYIRTHSNGEKTRRKILLQLYVHEINRLYTPTYREIMARTGIKSTSAIAYHIQVLQEQGLATRGAKGSARAILLTEEGKNEGQTIFEEKMEDPEFAGAYGAWIDELMVDRLFQGDWNKYRKAQKEQA